MPVTGGLVSAIPVIDIAPLWSGNAVAGQRTVSEIGSACREIGFLCITGTGVDSSLTAA